MKFPIKRNPWILTYKAEVTKCWGMGMGSGEKRGPTEVVVVGGLWQ